MSENIEESKVTYETWDFNLKMTWTNNQDSWLILCWFKNDSSTNCCSYNIVIGLLSFEVNISLVYSV